MKNYRVKMSKAIPVRIDQALLERIEALAKRIGEPQSTVMRIAMRIGLDGLEKAFEAGTPNLSSLIYPTPRGEVATAEERPAKPKKPKAA